MCSVGSPIQAYGDMFFERVCPTCRRFVRAYKTIHFLKNGADMVKFYKPNAVCKKHGKVNMQFIGFY